MNGNANNGFDPTQAIVDAAGKYGVDPDFALRIARAESNFNPIAYNNTSGAIGITPFPAVGYMLKKVGDAITMTKANAIVNAIATRSPLGRQMATSALPQVPRSVLYGLLSAPAGQ